LCLNERLLAEFRSGPSRTKIAGSTPTRMARVRILAVREDGEWRNILTTIRCRYGSREQQFSALEHDLGDEVVILGADLATSDADELVDDALAGRVQAGPETILYALAAQREHVATRGEVGKSLRMEPLHSPFADASAKVTEYWAAEEPEAQEAILSLLDRFSTWESKFGLRLSKRIDRVSNLVVFDAFDEIRVEAEREGDAVRVTARSRDEFEMGSYDACLDLYLDDDLVVSEIFPLAPPTQLRQHQVDWDAYRLRVFRRRDGRCVDDVAHYLLRAIHTRMHVGGGEIQVLGRDNKVIRTLRKKRLTTDVISSSKRSQSIRSRQLARRAYNREQSARADGDIFRFDPGEVEKVRFRLRKIVENLSASGPVYFADPYFFRASNELVKDLLFDLYEVSGMTPVRILAGTEPASSLSSDWPRQFRGNISARIVQRRRDKLKPGFHDRFVASPEGEFLLTHSTNGWNGDGVTIARLGHSVYFAQAEALWSRRGQLWEFKDLWQ